MKKTMLIAYIGVLSALGVLLVLLIRFPIIPAVSFMEVDFADVPAMIAGFAFGPVAGVITITVISLIQALTVSASSGWVGFVMHVIASGAYILTASLIYKKAHSFKGALLSLACGIIAGAAIMVPMNLVMVPLFMNVPFDTVLGMIVPAFLPFNLIKFTMVSVVTLLIYKPLHKQILKLNERFGNK